MAIITTAAVRLISCSGCGAQRLLGEDPGFRDRDGVVDPAASEWFKKHRACPDPDITLNVKPAEVATECRSCRHFLPDGRCAQPVGFVWEAR